MRPDQHKKKRSNQYKKKHETQVKNKEDSGKKEHNNGNRENHSTHGQHSAAGLKSSAVENVLKPSHVAAQEDEFISTFSKREVTSNWERYELEEEKETIIGEEFDILINATGGTSSYYSTESEQDLNESNCIEDSSIFAIDVLQLSQDLKSVPFMKKYRMAELEVNKSLIQAMLEGREEQEHIVVTSQVNPFAQALGFNFMNPKIDNEALAEMIKLTDSFTVKIDEHKSIGEDNAVDHSPTRNIEEDVEVKNSSHEPMYNELKNENVTQRHETNHVSDASNSTELPENPAAITKSHDLEVDDLDSELDTILNSQKQAHAAQSETQNNNITNPSEATLEEDDEEEDLEEWLDSIL